MSREIHFYTDETRMVHDCVQMRANGNGDYHDCYGWNKAECVINSPWDGKNVITAQMGLLNDAWARHFSHGDKIFIHDEYGVFEVKEECERTPRMLKRTTNIFRLWRSGEFRKTEESEEQREKS